MTKEEAITAKEAEVESYIGVLERYAYGRWYDSGRRHLEKLRQELKELKEDNGVWVIG